MNHLPLFMQLVYQWNVGKQIVESALNQIHSALQNPEATFDTEEEQAVTVIMPLKKQKLSKGKKKQTVTTPEVVLSLTQSISLLKAIVNDSLSKFMFSFFLHILERLLILLLLLRQFILHLLMFYPVSKLICSLLTSLTMNRNLN